MIIDKPDLLPRLFSDLERSEFVVLDTETSGLDPYGLSDRTGDEERAIGPSRICGLPLGIPKPDGELVTYYVPVRHESSEPQLDPSVIKDIMAFIERQGSTIVMHNAKFDLHHLGGDDALPDDRKVKIRDTMILEHVLNEESDSFALANMAVRRVGHDVSWKSWVKDQFRSRRMRRYSQFSVEELAPYAEDDVFMTWILHNFLYPKLNDPSPPWFGGDDTKQPELWGSTQTEVFETDMKLIWATMRMERAGLKMDREACYYHIEKLKGEEIRLKAELDTAAGKEVNYKSHVQLKGLFLDRGWPIPKDPDTGNPEFSDLRLAHVADQSKDPKIIKFVNDLYNYKRVTRFRGTYFEGYLKLVDESDYLHPDFWLHGTITARLSCHKPNFQNVPNKFGVTRTALKRDVSEVTSQAEVKKVIVPRDDEHRFVAMDYAQQEMRMFLHYADEPAMHKVFLEGGDIHELAAEALYGEPMPADKESIEYKRRRLQAKTINFGILYGMGPKKLSESMEISYERARDMYRNYLDTFKGVKATIRRVQQVADARLYIKTAFNRRRRFRLLTDQEIAQGYIAKGGIGRVRVFEGQRALSHSALNHLIQGSCADLTRRAMIRLDELLRGTKTYLVNTIHDELLFDVHVDERDELVPEIRRCLEEWPQFKIPFTTETKVSNWSWAETEKGK